MNGWAVMILEGVVANTRYVDGESHELLDGEYFHPDSSGPPPPTNALPSVARSELLAAVTAERDRRIGSGVLFQGNMFQSGPADRENVAAAAQVAYMAITDGAKPGDLRWYDPNDNFSWIATDNSFVPMDAKTLLELSKAFVSHKQQLTFSAREIKDAVPIPDDFYEDKWWVN